MKLCDRSYRILSYDKEEKRILMWYSTRKELKLTVLATSMLTSRFLSFRWTFTSLFSSDDCVCHFLKRKIYTLRVAYVRWRIWQSEIRIHTQYFRTYHTLRLAFMKSNKIFLFPVRQTYNETCPVHHCTLPSFSFKATRCSHNSIAST